VVDKDANASGKAYKNVVVSTGDKNVSYNIIIEYIFHFFFI
jgi:hypothetical protein